MAGSKCAAGYSQMCNCACTTYQQLGFRNRETSLQFTGRKAKFLIKKNGSFFLLISFQKRRGIPVERNKSNALTDKLAEEFNKHEQFQLAVTPKVQENRLKNGEKAIITLH